MKLEDLVTDEDIEVFLKINEISHLQEREVLRDILIISKLYDKNFKRIISEESDIKKKNYRIVEDLLNKTNNFLRENIGIRARDSQRGYKSEHKRLLVAKSGGNNEIQNTSIKEPKKEVVLEDRW